MVTKSVILRVQVFMSYRGRLMNPMTWAVRALRLTGQA
jgi:hypothetical protein